MKNTWRIRNINYGVKMSYWLHAIAQLYTLLYLCHPPLTLYFSCVGWLVRFCSIMDKVCNAFLASAAFAPRSNCCKAVSASLRTVRASPFLSCEQGCGRKREKTVRKQWEKNTPSDGSSKSKNHSPLVSSHVNIWKHTFSTSTKNAIEILVSDASKFLFGHLWGTLLAAYLKKLELFFKVAKIGFQKNPTVPTKTPAIHGSPHSYPHFWCFQVAKDRKSCMDSGATSIRPADPCNFRFEASSNFRWKSVAAILRFVTINHG